MKTLVLCVDRDDDVGTKTALKGPLIGRDENLVGATKLGLADPEDSDVNTMLTGIAVYDERVKLGEDAEVATITGDVRVGTISDRILTQQLEQVLEEVKPDRAFLVSDGAEDEYIFPIISSRIRVDHVRRVFVRQSPALESTYYMIVRAMRNPKIRRKILFPIGLALTVFSALLYYSPSIAPAIVGLAIGLYLLVISLPFHSLSDVATRSAAWYENLRTRFGARDFSTIFNIVAGILILLGISRAVDAARQILDQPNASVTQVVASFIGDSVWWFIVAVLIVEFGQAMTAYLQRGRAPRHTFIVAGSFMAIGLLVLGLTQILQGLMGTVNLAAVLPLIFVAVGLAILIIIAAASTYREREERPVEDSWRH